MDKFTKEIVDKFGNHLRIRICGLCIQNEHILLLKHHNLGQEGILWAPPGGGLKFGESIQAALEREFKEETNSTIEMGAFRFINEFIEPPLHAIELFYDVTLKDIPSLGKDPELSEELQLIHQLEWVPLKDIDDSPIFHPILKKLINV